MLQSHWFCFRHGVTLTLAYFKNNHDICQPLPKLGYDQQQVISIECNAINHWLIMHGGKLTGTIKVKKGPIAIALNDESS